MNTKTKLSIFGLCLIVYSTFIFFAYAGMKKEARYECEVLTKRFKEYKGMTDSEIYGKNCKVFGIQNLN